MSRNKPRPDRNHDQIVEIVPAHCPTCGSAEREPFHKIRSMEHDGYRITWRNTKCRQCGQLYRVREKVRITD